MSVRKPSRSIDDQSLQYLLIEQYRILIFFLYSSFVFIFSLLTVRLFQNASMFFSISIIASFSLIIILLYKMSVISKKIFRMKFEIWWKEIQIIQQTRKILRICRMFLVISLICVFIIFFIFTNIFRLLAVTIIPIITIIFISLLMSQLDNDIFFHRYFSFSMRKQIIKFFNQYYRKNFVNYNKNIERSQFRHRIIYISNSKPTSIVTFQKSHIEVSTFIPPCDIYF